MNLSSLAIALQAREPILAWGPPGIGKTAIINAVGRSLGLPVEIVLSSIREPTDFAGLPVIVDGQVKLAAPDWAQKVARDYDATNTDTIVFFDEISTAPPAVQAPLLRVCMERVVGDVQLPTSTPIVAAANPPEQAAGGWDLAPPLANRFLHIDWRLDNDSWITGMLAGFPDPVVKPLDNSWVKRIPEARRLVASYIKVRPMQLLKVPEDDVAAGKAWPSPRSWDMAARLLAASWAYDIPKNQVRNIEADLVGGCVGDAVGMEFLTWLEQLDLPDPEDLLANPKKFNLPQRGDQTMAVLSAVTSAIINKMNPDRWSAGWVILSRATSQGAPDMAAIAAKSLATELIERRKKGDDMRDYPIPTEQMKVLMPIFLAVGYKPV